jgi:hypothetical protein
MSKLLTPLKKLFPKKRPIVIPRDRQSYIDKQGWRLTSLNGTPQLEGWYRSRYGSYFGFIRNLDSIKPSFFIKDPPPELTNDPWHGNCFTLRPELGSGVHSIHFKTLPGDLSSGVLNIERTINEAFLFAKRSA